MQEFFTRGAANEGRKLPLFFPDGTESDHWLIVRGVDSDEFRMAESKAKRSAISFAQLSTEQERAEAIASAEIECIASLVAGWSFDKECSRENVMHFLREAPQIADAVNRYAAKRAEFFSKKSASSASGQNSKLNSKKSQKKQNPAAETN